MLFLLVDIIINVTLHVLFNINYFISVSGMRPLEFDKASGCLNKMLFV